MTKLKGFLKDCKTMTLRCLRLSLRNPGMIIISLMLPVLLLVLFHYVFGGVMDETQFVTTRINYLVVGAVIMAIAQSASTTAAVICSDANKGLLDRFLSLPISKSSFLVGHAISALVRNTISVIIMFGVGFAMGFRPEANFAHWLAAIGILILFMLVMTLFCTFIGLLVKTPETASSAQAVTQVLVFLSSAFVPAETMPVVAKQFSQYQPITPITETLRSLFFYGNGGGRLLEAILWLVGLLAFCYVLSFLAFRKKIRK